MRSPRAAEPFAPPPLAEVALGVRAVAMRINPHMRVVVLAEMPKTVGGPRSVRVVYSLAGQKLDRCYPLCDSSDVVILRNEADEDARELCELVGRAWAPAR